MKRAQFSAVVDVGHGDTHYVIVPFDPEKQWPGIPKVPIPRPHDPRGGKGWLVGGSVGGVKFEGHIGQRYGRTYLIVPAALCKLAGVREGDDIDIELAPLSTVPAAPAKRAKKAAKKRAQRKR